MAQDTHIAGTRNHLLRVALIAVSCYVAGRLGLLLAIPPELTIAVWPASGVALAGILLCGYRCWPGVLLGSLLVNVFIAFDASSAEAFIKSSFIVGGIAGGEALQAVLSAWFIRRVMSLPTSLESPKDIGSILLWGGLVGCVTNATISTDILSLAGVYQWKHFLSHWLARWGAGVAGVLVFTPVLLLLAAPRHAVSRARKLTVGISLVVTFSLTAYLFLTVAQWERERQALQFRQTAGEIQAVLEKDIAPSENILVAIERFFSGSESVSSKEFQIFTEGFFPLYPGLAALSWNAKVEDAGRDKFEESIRAQKHPGFVIKDRVAADIMEKAARRPVYFPVTYIEPLAFHLKILGLDTYGPDIVDGVAHKIALDVARDGIMAQATDRLSIVQDKGEKYGIMIYYPIYRKEARLDTLDARRTNLLGYAAATFIISDMVQASVNRIAQNSNLADFWKSLELILIDHDAARGKELLYDSRPVQQRGRSSPPNPEALHAGVNMLVAGHRWELQIFESDAALHARHNWSLWVVLIGGSLFTAMFSAFLLLTMGRTDIVQRLVDERTEALRKSEDALHDTLADLKQTNDELEKFAYVASHDLKSPLRAINNLAKWLEEDLADKIDSQNKERFDKLRGRAHRMERLLDDLLEYARAGHTFENKDPMQADQLILEISHFLHIPEGFTVKVDESLKPITIPRMPLEQVFQNLISNAVKHHDKKQGEITVSARADGDFYEFAVADDGPGIPKKFHAKVFEMFQTLKTRDEVEGSGMGLAMVQKIIYSFGGKVRLDSDEGRGTTIFFTWPKNPVIRHTIRTGG